MNIKTIFALGAVLIIIAVIVIGRTRLTASDFRGQKVSADNNDAAKTNGDESFVPLVTNENAAANDKDVLIAANRAETAPSLTI